MKIWKKSQHPGQNYCPSTGIESAVATAMPINFEKYRKKFIVTMDSTVLGKKTEVKNFYHKMNKKKFKIVQKPNFYLKIE